MRESQVSAWAQTFSFTVLLGYVGTKWMQFIVKYFYTVRMQFSDHRCVEVWRCQHGSVPGCHHSQLTWRTLSMSSPEGTTPTQGDIYDSRKNLVLNCAGRPGVQRLESCSHEIHRGKNTRLSLIMRDMLPNCLREDCSKVLLWHLLVSPVCTFYRDLKYLI